MRYQPGHKAAIHQKILKDAAQRVRTEGLNGAAVTAVMRDTGLTHGGFYKHFGSKDDLLVESLSEGFREIADTLVHAAEQGSPGEAWKAIVKAYLSPEHCEHPEHGCPLSALAPELARVEKRMKPKDPCGARELQKPNAAAHAWPANLGQRARFLCDFFNDNRCD
jgi:TetR/AcrR family transcriptional repressor of nem operon